MHDVQDDFSDQTNPLGSSTPTTTASSLSAATTANRPKKHKHKDTSVSSGRGSTELSSPVSLSTTQASSSSMSSCHRVQHDPHGNKYKSHATTKALHSHMLLYNNLHSEQHGYLDATVASSTNGQLGTNNGGTLLNEWYVQCDNQQPTVNNNPTFSNLYLHNRTPIMNYT